MAAVQVKHAGKKTHTLKKKKKTAEGKAENLWERKNKLKDSAKWRLSGIIVNVYCTIIGD